MEEYLKYKGYLGKLEFSVEDKVFFGKILDIADLITFEGASKAEIKIAFEDSVDDYIEIIRVLN